MAQKVRINLRPVMVRDGLRYRREIARAVKATRPQVPHNPGRNKVQGPHAGSLILQVQNATIRHYKTGYSIDLHELAPVYGGVAKVSKLGIFRHGRGAKQAPRPILDQHDTERLANDLTGALQVILERIDRSADRRSRRKR